jgi:hypothetical protein
MPSFVHCTGGPGRNSSGPSVLRRHLVPASLKKLCHNQMDGWDDEAGGHP